MRRVRLRISAELRRERLGIPPSPQLPHTVRERGNLCHLLCREFHLFLNDEFDSL